MTIGALINLATSEGQTINAINEACKRVRYRQSDCRLCSEVCPEQAISYGLGPEVSERCNQCGFCVQVCPTDTLQLNWDMKQYYLDQMQNSYDDGRSKEIEVHCQQSSPEASHSLSINCVGNFDENLILASAMIGFSSLEFSTGQCEACHFSVGKALCETAIERGSALVNAVDIKSFSIKLKERPKGDFAEEKLSRRSLFSKIGKNVKQVIDHSNYTTEDPLVALLGQVEGEERLEKHTSAKRKNLIQILNEYNKAEEEIGSSRHDVSVTHWRKMTVEQEKCVACAICVNVCPTGALSKTIQENTLFRYFSSTRCINCGVCEEACPHQIIHFTDAYRIEDIINDNPYLVAQVSLSSCMICGETIPASEGEVCTTCEKRQVSPMFFNKVKN